MILKFRDLCRIKQFMDNAMYYFKLEKKHRHIGVAQIL